MPSEIGKRQNAQRSRTRGIVLLDVLIAFAVMALVATVTLNVVSRADQEDVRRLHRAVLLEFARSKAEEYAVSYPVMPAEGEEPGGWAWSVAERRVHPDGPNRFDADIALFEVRMTVWNKARPDDREEVRTIVARRA